MKERRGGCGWAAWSCLGVFALLVWLLWMAVFYEGWRLSKLEQECKPYAGDDWDYKPDKCILTGLPYYFTLAAAGVSTVILLLGGLTVLMTFIISGRGSRHDQRATAQDS